MFLSFLFNYKSILKNEIPNEKISAFSGLNSLYYLNFCIN